MIDKYDVEKYLDDVISDEYYISIIVEDIIKYFKYRIISDTILNDVRTIKLSNFDDNIITIKSTIVSFINQPFCQLNKIYLDSYNGNSRKIWNSYGKCYKSKK